MALNFGIASPPPRKKSGLPPKVGGKPHMTVVVAAIPKGKPKPGLGDDEEEPPAMPPLPRAAGRKLPPPGRAFGAEPDEPPDDLEGMGDEGDEGDEANEPPPAAGGGAGEEHPILPEAVSYRSEQETCANCVHMQDDGECARLHIPVSHGDGCNLFTDASGEDADESAEQYEPEEEEENEPAYR